MLLDYCVVVTGWLLPTVPKLGYRPNPSLSWIIQQSNLLLFIMYGLIRVWQSNIARADWEATTCTKFNL